MQEKINPADFYMSAHSGFVIYNPNNKRTWIKESGEHIEIDISPKPQPKQ